MCPFCCSFNLAIGGTQLQEIKETQHAYTGSTHTDLLWSAIHNCIPDACPIHSRYQTGNRGRYLYDIGFLTVAGCLCMTRFQWKLNLWIWCSGVWPMNCFGRNRCHLGCVDLWDDKDLLGSEFPDHLDHGRPNELMNFCPEWSHQFIWSSMIWEISDHLSSFGLSQRTHS